MVLNDGKTTADGLILFYTERSKKKTFFLSFLFKTFVFCTVHSVHVVVYFYVSI